MANGFGGAQPQPQRMKGQGRSGVMALPAPWGGWNARDALTAMRPEDAIQLDNFIPDAGGIRLRLGYAVQAPGVDSRVDTVMGYNPPAGTGKLFAAGGTSIYDCTTTAATASAAVTGLTNAKFQHIMHGTPAGSYLVVCNGADKPRKYDGSAWTTATVTGVTASSQTFVNVTSHQSRLWFAQLNTLDAWYLPVASIGGAAVRLPLGPYCRKGGYLQAIASWTRDGGSGLDDQIVFLTSAGEAVLYSGSDPSSSTLWQKVGTFNIPEPVGRRCFVQIGADLGLITSQGVVPLSSILPLSSAGAAKVAATDKISGAFDTAYHVGKLFFGWQAIEFPHERLLVINVPVTESTAVKQYVMNTMNGSWCQFLGINANCWGQLGDAMFFGGLDGTVYQYGRGTDDNGTAIEGISWSAFTDLGSANMKQVVEARAMILAVEGYVPGIDIRTDYDLSLRTIYPVSDPSEGGGTFWDEGYWASDPYNAGTDTAPTGEWGVGQANSAIWQTVSGIGKALSVGMAVSTHEAMRFNAVDLMVERGGYL